ncbi:GerW family sporulation protein [Halochromatium sp.]
MTQDVEDMVHAVLSQMQTALDTKHVVGEPIQIGDYTIVPLMSVGFGFGTGKGTGKGEELMKGEGMGWASAGGGGMKPLAVVLIGPDGATVESLKGATASVVETLAQSVLNARNKDKDAND